MNKISAVICELNPAHEGHKYIFEQAKAHSDTVVAIMSGNFVQRGENAIYDKYKRAEAAIEIGADLVLELPFPWSAASAEYFSAAAVDIAKKIGVDCLVFGSECGDKSALYEAAKVLSGDEFNSIIPGEKRAAEYRTELLREKAPHLPEKLLSSANDILGIEYIKNADNIECFPIKRISCHSATSIRESMRLACECDKSAVFSDKLFDLEFYKMRFSDKPCFITAESGGGVGERLYKSALISENGIKMLENSKTKQYTNARLRRAALFYLCNVLQSELKEMPQFTCVLASNGKGRKVLSDLRRKSSIAVISKPSAIDFYEEKAKKQIEKTHFADSIYTMLMSGGIPADYFIKKSPVIK